MAGAAFTTASKVLTHRKIQLVPPQTDQSKGPSHSPQPIVRKLDPLSPLSVGNGEFAFTADITGLQTFSWEYEQSMPLCTMSQWGWHTTPLPAGLDPQALRLTQYDTHGRQVGYHTSSKARRNSSTGCVRTRIV